MKRQLLELWPKPEIVRDVAKFVGFAQFYSVYIHHFELLIAPLREITIKSEYTDPVAPLWSDAAQRSLDNVKEAILSDPCLMRFNHNRLIVLRTDFSAKGLASLFANLAQMTVRKPQWLCIDLVLTLRS